MLIETFFAIFVFVCGAVRESAALSGVCTGPGNPGKSLNFMKSFSRSGKSWNFDKGPGKSWKSELGYIF